MGAELEPILSTGKWPGNTQTRRRHRIEVWWQIAVPLLLAIALVFGGAYLVGVNETGNAERLAQIAMMLLSIPLLLIGLIFLTLFAALIYVLGRAIRWIPPRSLRVQRAVQRFSRATVRLADVAAEPLIQIESAAGAVRHALGRDQNGKQTRSP